MIDRLSSRVSAAATAIVIAAAVGAPALAQANATIVLGESPARTCYEHAASGRFTTAALDDCTHVFEVAEISIHDRSATYVNRAVIRQARGDLDGAFSDLMTAVELEPTLAAAHLNLGGLFVQQGQWAEARAALDQGIMLDPTAARANDYFARAAAREELGDIEGAYADYQEAARLAPEWELPRQELERFQVVSPAGDGAS